MLNDYSELLNRAAQLMARSVWNPNFLFTKAKGSTIWLNGEPYLDFACGPGVANVGHNHPEVIEAVKRVLDNDEAGWGGNMLLNRYQVELAEKLCELTPGKFPKRVFFSNSGGEAVEAAMIACMRRRPERRGMVSFIGDFHGRIGFGRTATTSKPLHIEGLPWGIEKALFLIFPAENPETPAKQEFMENFSTARQYLNYVENTLGPFVNDINFALFELIQGEGGINVAQKEMIQALFRYLRDHKVCIIVDEVQSGFGRTGNMWVSDFYEVEPDIITVAKALSGGVVPIGATIFREELAYQKVSEHANTYGAIPQACAAGLKVLEILQKEKLAEKAATDGDWLIDSLSSSVSSMTEVVKGASGIGLMSRLTLQNVELRDRMVVEAMKRGLFLMSAGEQSVRLMPPLSISREELQKGAEILLESVQSIR